MLTKIISGGQSGADQAGLRAAAYSGVATGGRAARGWWTEDGPMPSLGAEFGLVEHPDPEDDAPEDPKSPAFRGWLSRAYRARTAANVRDSDVTFLFGDDQSSGSKALKKAAAELGRPIVPIPYVTTYYPAIVLEWFYAANVVNVAGNRASADPNIGHWVERWWTRALDRWRKRCPFEIGDEVFCDVEHVGRLQRRVIADIRDPTTKTESRWWITTRCGLSLDASWFRPADD